MIRLILFGLAVAAATAAFMIHYLGGPQPPAPAEPSAPAPQIAEVQVLVTQRALPERHRIAPGDIGWAAWPESRVQPFFTVAEAEGEAPPAKIEGLYTNRRYSEGEPLDVGALKAKLVERLSDRVSPGMRAVSVAVSAVTTAGGFVKVDDHVDIIRVGEAGGGGPGSNVILENVRVLAVGSSMDGSPGTDEADTSGTQAANPGTVTVELTPHQANLLASADYEGQLALTLRSRTDRAPIAQEATGPETPVKPTHSIKVLQDETWVPYEVP